MSHTPNRRRARRPLALAAATAVLLATAVPAQAAPPWSGADGRPAALVAPLTPASTEVTGSVVGSRLKALATKQLPTVGVAVQDAVSGEAVYESNGSPKTPASTMKVLSALVSLNTLGPEKRFLTTVVPGAEAGEIVLVGGGDPLLKTARKGGVPGAASLEDLANQTAASLKRTGTTSVTLRYDGSLFSGPAWSSDWPETFKWSVAPITALKVDHARPDPKKMERAASPNQHAADNFARLLKNRGITVDAPKAARAPAGGVPLAEVESLPVASIVEHILLYSDNDASETLLWLAAREAGRQASGSTARAYLTEQLRELGLWAKGMVVADGNGISARNRVAPAVLARAIRMALTDPRLRAVATGLPVAGGTGTLADRYDGVGQAAGRGVVRAKTGSIRTVDSLAGYVVTADGHVWTFAMLLNDTPRNDTAKQWLDQATSVLAACGC